MSEMEKLCFFISNWCGSQLGSVSVNDKSCQYVFHFFPHLICNRLVCWNHYYDGIGKTNRSPAIEKKTGKRNGRFGYDGRCRLYIMRLAHSFYLNRGSFKI